MKENTKGLASVQVTVFPQDPLLTGSEGPPIHSLPFQTS